MTRRWGYFRELLGVSVPLSTIEGVARQLTMRVTQVWIREARPPLGVSRFIFEDCLQKTPVGVDDLRGVDLDTFMEAIQAEGVRRARFTMRISDNLQD
jgi:hypothetical protein